MIDPFSLATGIAGLVSLTIQVTQIISNYTSAVKDASGNARDLQETVLTLSRVLEQLGNFLRSENAKGSAFDQTSVLCATTNLCKRTLDSMLRRTEGLHEGGKFVQAVKRVKWPLSDAETQRMIVTLHGCTETFQLSLTVDGCALLSKTSDDVALILTAQMDTLKQMTEMSRMFSNMSIATQQATSVSRQVFEVLRLVKTFQQNSDEMQELSDNVRALKIHVQDANKISILDWLSSIEYEKKHSDVRAQRRGNTGDWVLQTEQFQKWRDDSSSSYLWCHGIPGAGKTVITSLLIDHLKEYFRDRNIGLAYFYCDYRDQERQTTSNVVACLLRQLLSQKTTQPNQLSTVYLRCKRDKKQPDLEELLSLLQNYCQEFDYTYIIVDALDESDANQHRKQLLRVLKELQHPSTRLLVTSRTYPEDIKRQLADFPQIIIEAIDSDIREFLVARIDENDSMTDLINDALKEEILAALAGSAQGMFLLPSLQIRTILDQTTRAEIRRSLKAMPTELSDTFKETLTRIKSQPRSRSQLGMKTLLWTSLTKRPLRVNELCQALAVRSGDPDLDEDNLPLQRFLIESCSGLVTIDVESSIIRLVHLSLQEYFQAQAQDLFPSGAKTIAETSLTYLSFGKFALDPDISVDDLLIIKDANPLLEYAAQYWGYHARESPESVIQRPILDFLQKQSNVHCAARFIYFNDGDVMYTRPRHLNALHLTAKFGLRKAAEELCIHHNVDVNSMDLRGRTPLSFASQYGYEDVVYSLVEVCHADVNLVGRSHARSPLVWAATNGHKNVVEFLYSKEANIKKIADEDLALRMAASGGYVDVASFLIEKGADVNAGEIYYGTALTSAARSGHEEMVKLLLHHGAEISIEPPMGSFTALESAVMGDHEAIVRLLLEEGANPNLSNIYSNYTSVLTAAIKHGAEPIVRLLLQFGADLNQWDEHGQNPLHSASENGNEDIVRLLIEKGADPNVADERGRTPLLFAAESWNDDIVRFLVESGADPNVADRRGRTPLLFAAENGDEDVVRFLIESGADWSKTDDLRRSAFTIAKGEKYTAMVAILESCRPLEDLPKLRTDPQEDPNSHVEGSKDHFEVTLTAPEDTTEDQKRLFELG